MALTLLSLALVAPLGAGCTVGSSSTPSPSAIDSTATTPAAPQRLTKAEYQQLLTGSETTVRRAFEAVVVAKSLDDVKAAAERLFRIKRQFLETLPYQLLEGTPNASARPATAGARTWCRT